jgi:hypothetical protein
LESLGYHPVDAFTNALLVGSHLGDFCLEIFINGFEVGNYLAFIFDLFGDTLTRVLPLDPESPGGKPDGKTDVP